MSGCLYYLAVLVHIINCLLISVLGISLEKKRQFEQSIANASLCPYERKRNLNDNLKGKQPYKHSFSLSEKEGWIGSCDELATMIKSRDSHEFFSESFTTLDNYANHRLNNTFNIIKSMTLASCVV